MRAYVTVLDGDDDLLPFFVRHYRRLGATQFPVLVYGNAEDMDRAQRIVRAEGGQSVPIEVLPPSEFSTEGREALIASVHHNGEWAFFCDLDEFAELDVGQARSWVEGGAPFVGGRWLDRVAAGGRLVAVTPNIPLEAQFPFAARTRRAWKLNNSIYVLSPRAPTIHHPNRCKWGRPLWPYVPKITVHHFRWQSNIVDRLKARLVRAQQRPSNAWWIRHLRETLGRLSECRGLDERLLFKVGCVLGV